MTHQGNARASRLLWLALASWWFAVLTAGAAHAVERAVEKQIDVPATLDQAWEAWTTRDGITSFFAPDAHIEPQPGGAFEIFFDPSAQPGSKGADGMQYMALQPKKMLSFTWNAPPHLPQARAQRTLVIVRFEPVDDKTTRIKLHHTGWGDGGQWDQAYAYFDRAWAVVLAGMKRRFEQGPQDWTEWLERLRKAKEPAPTIKAP